MFEALVSDLLNRFIGDYVENLDKSQLKIGIWGGERSYEFDVPFRIKAGQITKLTLKIPWKNLYSEAVVATLEGLYLLVVPGSTIKYDAAKEEKYQQELKQRELQRIEDALQMATQKAADEKKDTFVEKLATQVIKNLQVKISSIHLRYEDDVSDNTTTDENWKACILNEAAKISYKVILQRVQKLFVFYFSSQTSTYILHFFKPIFASAKMCINPNAEVELKMPKAQLQLEVQNIAIEITKPQYLAMVDVLESIDSMVKNAPYRKFRPEVPVHTNAAVWWKYAFNSIMEVHVRRCSKMWSWYSIKQHRETLKAYRNLHLTISSASSDPPLNPLHHLTLSSTSSDLEKVLDVFNITLIRQQAKMERCLTHLFVVQVIRSGQKLVAKKSAGQKQGWFGGWFGKKAKKDEQEQEESKETEGKCWWCSGRVVSTPASQQGPWFDSRVCVLLSMCDSLLVTIREKPEIPEILKVQIIDLSTKISQRPGAQAIRLEAALQHWYVTGLQQQGAIPSLITSMGDSSSSLLNVAFEINPEESTADQLLRVHSQPVEIIYDALTVNSLVDFFKTGKGVDLEVLTSATLSKLEEIKEKTASGLSHIIETRKVFDLKIDLKPSYLLLPKSGFYSNTSDLIIVDFGSLKVSSVLSPSPSSSLEEIMDRAYERFGVQLRKVQVLYSKSGEAWRAARQQSSSVQHILQPMDFSLQLAKSMVDNDARMAKFKVSGELPLLHVKISDQKIQSLFDLVDSIPLPNMGSAASTPTDKVKHYHSLLSTVNFMQSAIPSKLRASSERDAKKQVEKTTQGKTGEHE
uniref:Chorein N-terminal domain-containing protein n=1 Tax=Periophthalmus magnuspinnatus TaxID=409849 RepID=A0A3B3ZVV2_9GOBI